MAIATATTTVTTTTTTTTGTILYLVEKVDNKRIQLVLVVAVVVLVLPPWSVLLQLPIHRKIYQLLIVLNKHFKSTDLYRNTYLISPLQIWFDLYVVFKFEICKVSFQLKPQSSCTSSSETPKKLPKNVPLDPPKWCIKFQVCSIIISWDM